MPDDLWVKIYDRWPELSLLLAILFRSQLAALVPQVIKDYFTSRQKLREDRQEHQQALQDKEAKLSQLSKLVEMNDDAYLKQLYTQNTSELYTQLSEANSFIRQDITAKLDVIIQQQLMILREIKRSGNGNGTYGISNADTQKIDRAD